MKSSKVSIQQCFVTLCLCVVLLSCQLVGFGGGITAFAAGVPSLGEVINGTPEPAPVQETPAPAQSGDTPTAEPASGGSNDRLFGAGSSDYTMSIDDIKSATDGKGGNGEVVSGAQGVIKMVTGTLLPILSYFICAFLAVQILINLVYITVPFIRGFLDGGMGAAAGPQGGPQGGMGMQGGAGGYGGGMGMQGGYGGGGGRYGNHGGAQQGTAGPAGKTRWVSDEALNAVQRAGQSGPDGKSQGAVKMYLSSMVITLVIVPVLVVLTATGAISNIGFFIAEKLVSALSGIG